MVTKPTGRPRGRPAKAPTPKKARGRPSIPFLSHPDRYLVAMMDAHAMINDTSKRKAATFIAAMQVGNEVGVPPEFAVNCPPGFVPIGWGPRVSNAATLVNTKPGAVAGSIDGRAATLREVARESRSDPDAVRWRINMASVFFVVHSPLALRPYAKDCVLMLAAQIGETAVAINHILPMIDHVRAESVKAPE